MPKSSLSGRLETDYKPVLSQICGLIPQDTMTELATALQAIYRINLEGGHGSRRKVSQLLLELGLQPQK